MRSATRFFGFLFCLFSVLLNPVCCPAQAKNASGVLVGKVDFQALVLLHPGMKSYDVQKGAFKLETPDATSQQKMQQRSEQQKERMQQLEQEIETQRKKLAELHGNKTKSLATLADAHLKKIAKLATGPAGLKQQQFEIDQMRLTSLYEAKLKAVSGQILVVSEEMGRLDKLALHPGFTSPEETATRFQGMVSEVRQFVQKISSQKGIQIVFNSSYQRSIRADIAKSIAPVSPEVSYAQILTHPTSSDEKGAHNPGAEYQEQVFHLTTTWLGQGNAILAPLKSELLDSDIVVGGMDITADVLQALLGAHKINPTTGSALLKAISQR
jgi:hypothetical protein